MSTGPSGCNKHYLDLRGILLPLAERLTVGAQAGDRAALVVAAAGRENAGFLE